MRLCIVLFAMGAWLLQQQAELPDLRYAWLLLVAAPALYFVRGSVRSLRWTGVILLAAGALGAGFFWAAALAHLRMADALPPQWEGRDVELVGVVASLPQPYERSVRFDFDVEHVLTGGARVPKRVSLSWW